MIIYISMSICVIEFVRIMIDLHEYRKERKVKKSVICKE